MQWKFFGKIVHPLPVSILASLIWIELGSIYMFLTPLAAELFFRNPLFTTLPESRSAGRPSAKGE